MKKVTLILSAFALIACGGKEKKDVKDFTYEQRVADVCECFKTAEDPDDCYLIQADHISYLKDEEVVEFINKSNLCSPN